MKTVLPFATVVVGIVLLLLGLGWSSLFPAAASWTPEMNDKLSTAETDLRAVGFRLAEAKSNPQMHSGEGVPTLQAKHDELKKEYDALLAEFESARDAPATTGGMLKWVGIGAVAVGAVLAFLNKQDA
jgi:uncharacterized protein YjeT (DUF2065 family)